jgi:hypothetical protein
MPSPLPAPAPIDGSAATPSLRTLGTGANQAAAGNDSRLVGGGDQTFTGQKTFADGLVAGDSILLWKTSSLPVASPALEGAILYDDTENVPKYCNGTSWLSMVGGEGGGGYVQKAGDVMTGELAFSGISAGTAAISINSGARLYLGTGLAYLQANGTAGLTVGGTITATNFSGSNTGDVTFGAVGSIPNAAAASVAAGQVITLQPASATQPGLITAGTQNLAGNKNLAGTLTVQGQIESTTGGVKFPDATTATTAAVGGWIVVSNVTSGAGAISNKVYQDTGNTILRSCTASNASVTLAVKASYPKVLINGTAGTLTLSADGGHYSGNVAITAPGGAFAVRVLLPNDAPGFTDSFTITIDAPPIITALAFSGSYPGSQTELKAGDTYTVSGTTNKPVDAVQVSDFGAGTSQTITFGSTTSFSVSITIADRGTTPQSLAARMAARDLNGAWGSTADTSNTVVLNNLYPTATIGSITYPGAQGAIKTTESATVAMTIANTNVILFDSPVSQLTITSPTVSAATKTVTYLAGSYNVSTNNFRVTATRSANAAVTTNQGVVKIANVAPTITVSAPAARLRSGGNNGTSVQNHTITITSDQQLASAPTMSAGAAGTFTGSWSGGPTSYTRTLQVHDNDTKGSYSFGSLLATGLAGLTQTTISSGSAYVLGGFVQRNLTFSAFSQTTALNVAVVTYSKLQAGLFTATNQASTRNSSQGDHSNLTNTFTVDALSTNPTTIWWNDVAAASSNSGGTAQLLAVEETV